MKISLALLSGLFAAAVSGLAIPSAEADVESVAVVERDEMLEIRADSSDASIISGSALDWAAGENVVSDFLDLVAGKKFRNQKAYHKAARNAWKRHKAGVRDYDHLGQYLDGNQGYQSGNSTLSDGGALGHITDLLYELTTLNWTKDLSDILEIVNEINFGSGTWEGRCGALIPAIDDVLTAASDELLSLLPTDTTLDGLKVAVPKSCKAGTKRDIPYGPLLVAPTTLHF